MTPLSPNLRGALLLTLGMATATVSDATVKYVSTHMATGEVILLRGVVASLAIFLLARHRGALGRPRDALHPMVILRVIGEAGAAALYLLALTRLPLADVSAIFQVLPLGVTFGAALFLAEPVGWRRWLATGFGFAGVMIIVRPGFSGFSPDALLVIGAVVFAATRDLATRRVPSGISSLFISMLTAPGVAITGAAMAIASGGWQPVSLFDGALVALAGVLSIATYQFLAMSMREGDLSFVAPFRYTRLLWSIIVGLLFFAEFPDAPTFVGAALVIVSGLYTLQRERKRARIVQAPPSATE